MDYDIKNYAQLKEQTEKEYKKIDFVKCPALGGSRIVFNSNGFHHLVYDESRKERSKKSQYGKFFYFHDAVNVIKKSTTIQQYRRALRPIGNQNKNGFRKTKIIEWFAFESILSFEKGIRIRAVVRRIGADTGQFHFWSVMPIWNLSGNVRIIGQKSIEDE